MSATLSIKDNRVMNTTILAVVVIVFLSVFGLFFLVQRESELNEIVIPPTFYEKGEKLSVVLGTFESAIQENGFSWNILVDPKISTRSAKWNFGGSGHAINFAFVISESYDVKVILFEKERIILYLPK